MGRDHLSNDEFFSQLSSLLDSNRAKGHGSITLLQKRMIHSNDSTASTPNKTPDDPLWDTHPENPLPIIVRASNNHSAEKDGTERENKSKEKFSTIVQPDATDAFYARYADVCKAGMTALKKRDRSKRKKDKAKKRKTGEGEKKG